MTKQEENKTYKIHIKFLHGITDKEWFKIGHFIDENVTVNWITEALK